MKDNKSEMRPEAQIFKLEVITWQRRVFLVWGEIERCLVALYKMLRRNAQSVYCLKINFGRELIRLEDGRGNRSFSFSDGSGRIFIVMPHMDPDCASDIADLAHECLHVANFMLREESVYDVRNVEEAFAYAQTFILSGLLKMVFEQSGKKCGGAGCDKSSCVCKDEKQPPTDESTVMKNKEIKLIAKKLKSYGRRRISKNVGCARSTLASANSGKIEDGTYTRW